MVKENLQKKFDERRRSKVQHHLTFAGFFSSFLGKFHMPHGKKKIVEKVEKDLKKKQEIEKKRILVGKKQEMKELQDGPNVAQKVDEPKKKKGFFGLFAKKDKFKYVVYDEDKIKKEREKSYNQLKKTVLLEDAVASLLVKQAKNKNKKHKRLHRRDLQDSLDKCGYDFVDGSLFPKKIMHAALALNFILTIIVFSMGIINRPGTAKVALFLLGLWTGVFAFLYVMLWFSVFVYLDFRMFNRKLEVEEILPDFLQLTSANIAAGMTIDKALWYAVRPRFGVLAKEIEVVAKLTIVGHDLDDALHLFASKYDSKILNRSIDILLEGLESGGKMGELLNKIALNIQEGRILRREMSANVMTYVIFISFATVAAAPFLFALSTQLLVVIQQIADMLVTSGAGGVSSSIIPISVTEKSVSLADFKVFSMGILLVTSLFSACIVSVISKGNVKEGVKYIPVFMIISVILYYIASWGLSLMFGSFL